MWSLWGRICIMEVSLCSRTQCARLCVTLAHSRSVPSPQWIEEHRVRNGHTQKRSVMTKTVSKGLARLAETDPGRSYRANTSPLYLWIDEHCEEIEALRYEKGWSWEKLVSAAIEDGLSLENTPATWKKCRARFTRIRALRRKRALRADRPGEASHNPKPVSPSRVPADWRPASVEEAYSHRPLKKNESASERTVSVADQTETLRSHLEDRKETPEERAARLTNEIEEKLFAQKRARGPGFLTE